MKSLHIHARLVAAASLIVAVNIAMTTTAAAQTTVANAKQAYPSKPIHLLPPSGVGGQPDIVARIISPKMSEGLRQPVALDSRPGAGTCAGHRPIPLEVLRVGYDNRMLSYPPKPGA